MIKTSAKGCYDISVDGGVTFIHKQKNLILNNYYNKSSLTTQITMVVGSNGTPPQITDTSLGFEFGSASSVLGFDSTSENKVFSDRFEVTYSKLFDLGTGYTHVLRELGIKNPDLCSRALLSAPDGQPTNIQLLPIDHLVIRYSVTYIIPRTPQVFALTINGQSVNATVTAVNGEFGGWGTVQLAEVIRYSYIGYAAAGTWSLDANGNIIGPNISNLPEILTTTFNNISGLNIIGTASIDSDEWVGSFQQLLITSNGFNFITAPILIDLDVPVTKTSLEVTTISINVNQSA